jgi:predicted DNA-binding transcriptional regulator YafY
MVKAWGGAAMAEAAEEALVKIESVLPEALKAEVDAVPVNALQMGDLSDEQRILIDTLEGASRSKTRLQFDYRDKDGGASQRTVRPLGFGIGVRSGPSLAGAN